MGKKKALVTLQAATEKSENRLQAYASAFFNFIFLVVVLFVVGSSVGSALNIYRLDTVLTGSIVSTCSDQ